MSFDRYLQELQNQEPTREVAPADLAKTAGVRVPPGMCDFCGGAMKKLGSTEVCLCGFQKSAAGPGVPMGPAPMPQVPPMGSPMKPPPAPGEGGSLEDRAMKLIEKGMAAGQKLLEGKGELPPEQTAGQAGDAGGGLEGGGLEGGMGAEPMPAAPAAQPMPKMANFPGFGSETEAPNQPSAEPPRADERMSELDRLRRQTSTESNLSPAGGVLGGLMGGGLGSELGGMLGGSAGRLAGTALGGLAGVMGGSSLGDQIASILQSRREMAEQAAGQAEGHSQPPQPAPMGSLPPTPDTSPDDDGMKMAGLKDRLKSKFTPKTDEFGRSVIDLTIGKGVPYLSTPSALPTGPIKKRVDLAPGLGLSPTVGAGPYGLTLGVRLKRRPKGVPSNSIVGKGLDAQRAERGGEMQLNLGANETGSAKEASFLEALSTGLQKSAENQPVFVQQSPFGTRAVFRTPESQLASVAGEGAGTLGGAAGGAALGRRLGGTKGMLLGSGVGALLGGGLGRFGAQRAARAADVSEYEQKVRLTPAGAQRMRLIQRLRQMRQRASSE